MQVNIDNPIKLHNAISFEEKELKDQRKINILFKSHLSKLSKKCNKNQIIYCINGIAGIMNR